MNVVNNVVNQVVSIEDVSFAYRAGRPILDGVSFSMAPGTLVWLRGGNGAGKSTLFRLIAGQLRPGSGRVTVGGRPATSRAAFRLRWFMESDPALYRLLTVEEQITFYARLHAVPPGPALEALWPLRLADHADALCGELSSGQARKVWFVCSMFCHRALVLLLDEPFNAVDAESVPVMVEMISERVRGGGAVAVSSHAYAGFLSDPLVTPLLHTVSLSAASSGPLTEQQSPGWARPSIGAGVSP